VTTDTRRFTVGGSDCGAAAGVNPYLSPIGLWAIKTGRIEQPASEAMEWGTRLQLPIMDALASRGYDVRDAFDSEPLVSERYKWATGSPDGYTTEAGERAVLEIKTASVWAHRSGWDDDLPPHYAAQGQWYMMLTGLRRCVFAVLVGGQRLEVRTVNRSDHAIRLLLAECERFHSHLVNDTPPRPDASSSSRDALAALFPQGTADKVVRLTRTQMRTLDELRTLKAKAAALDNQIAERENVLREAMGDATVAISPADDEVVRWSNVSANRIDTKRLKADRPDIAGEYTYETLSRRFTVL
jgi:putative phage-type endonuclease